MLALSLTLTLTLNLALALTCVIEKSRMTPRYMKMVTPSAVFVKSPLARISPTMLRRRYYLVSSLVRELFESYFVGG